MQVNATEAGLLMATQQPLVQAPGVAINAPAATARATDIHNQNAAAMAMAATAAAVVNTNNLVQANIAAAATAVAVANHPPVAPTIAPAPVASNTTAIGLEILAAAIAVMTTAVQAMAQANTAPSSPRPILDPHSPNTPYDLASRAGLNAFTQASAPLETKWDGTAERFPPFLLALRIQARDVKWDSTSPSGILHSFGGSKHLLDEYSGITPHNCAMAHAARTDNRARQNAKAMYHTLKLLINGMIKTTIFDQHENIPNHDDGPTLLILITQFTLSSAIQLLMLVFCQILNFGPFKHNYIVPAINTQLNHLVVMATTNNRSVSDAEKLQHIITMYDCIKQPKL